MMYIYVCVLHSLHDRIYLWNIIFDVKIGINGLEMNHSLLHWRWYDIFVFISVILDDTYACNLYILYQTHKQRQMK